tara:strand:+ start:647 stop:2425 length:1779 start_codon:yes stop_codon:yes gene_type:complete
MKIRQIIKNISLLIALFVFTSNHQPIKAEPWAMPDDLLIRHDIYLLVDSGVLNIPITTWPLSWGDIAYNLSKNESEMTLIELASFNRVKNALVDAQELGIFGETEIKLSKNPKQLTSFNDIVSQSKSIAAGTSYFSKNIAMNIKFEKTPGNENMDDSYLSVARGNYSLTLGSKKNWWGPGWNGSLALSTNARPLNGLSIERNFSDPSKSRFFSWVGPWDLSILIAEMENSRQSYAARIGIRPLQNLEIGLVGTVVDSGKNIPCESIECTNSSLYKEDSNYHLTGFDFRSSQQWKDTPFASYGQIIGESVKNSMGLFGFETWGSMDGFKTLEGYRIYTEVTSTSCGFYKNNSSKYGCAYQNATDTDGYRYQGTNIGHSIDGDSRLISIGAILIGENSQLFKSSLSIGQLNRGSTSSYQLVENRTDYFNFDLGYQFDLYWFDIGIGSFDLGVGLDLFKDKVTGNSDNQPRVYLSWVKDATLNSSESRNYSDYIELIEVSDQKIIEESIIEDQFSIDQYLLLNELNLDEIILIVDKVSQDRNDNGDPFSTRSIKKNQSISGTFNDLNIDLIESPNDLSEYMNLMDQTINQRGNLN